MLEEDVGLVLGLRGVGDGGEVVGGVGGVDVEVLLELLLELFDEVGVLDVGVLGLGFEDGGGAFLEEGHVVGDDVLDKDGGTSRWNITSCLRSRRME